MEELYAKYPELKANDFYLTGESYAGKYVPMFAVTILDSNAKKAAEDIINLKAVMIIDPYTVPVLQRTTMFYIGQATNILDDTNL